MQIPISLGALCFVFLAACHSKTDGTPLTPAPAPHGDEVALPDLEPKWRVVARWFGSFNRDIERFATNEPGHFMMSPHNHQVSSGNVVLREEMDDVLGLRRTVVESFSWSSSVSDMYYFNHRTGARTPAGPGGSGGESYGESELSSPGSISPEVVAESRREFEEARTAFEGAAREKQQAERAVAEAEANNPNGGNAPPVMPAPTTQVAAEALEAQQKMVTVLSDGSSSQQAREAAIKRMQETAQAYADWMTRKTAELEKKYTAEMDQLQRVTEDQNATDAQREEAGNRLVMISDAMVKEHQEMFGMPAERPKEPREQLEEAQRKLDGAREDLVRARAELWRNENIRAQRVEANSEVINWRADGKTVVRAHIGIPSGERELATFTVPGDGDSGDTRKIGAGEERRFGVDPAMSGEAVADEDGAATISKTETGGGGEDGLIGGATYTKSFTLSRVPVKQQLRFKGKLYHRIRVPTTGSSEPSLILRGGNPISLAGAIPVMGSVRVEGRLYEPGEVPPPPPPTPTRDFVGPPAPDPPAPSPPINTADSNDGEFDLVMPLKPGKIVRLTFVYHNSDAQVTERVHVDVPVDVATHAWGQIPGSRGRAPTAPLDRYAECSLRWETKPRMYALGSERRGASVERENDWHIVEFEGFNAVLVNTFILQTPYLNQNRHAFTVKAKVPAKLLLAARPQSVPEATVRSRLGVPATGPAPEETEIDVSIRGPFVCFPTSVAVSLAALGLIDIDETALSSDEVRKLAQAIYDHYDEKHAKNSQGMRGMPEVFPFPDSPAQIDALDRDAAAAATGSVPAAVVAMQDALRNALRPRYNHWPFVTGNDTTMKWLISLRTTKEIAGWFGTLEQDVEDMRPWQWAWITDSCAKAKFGINAYTYATATTPGNVFTADPNEIFHVLGRGCGSVISIAHRSTTGARGGHLIALVGVVTDGSGGIMRWIFHDPYGDQTRNPSVMGYYEPNKNFQRYDKDPPELSGAPATWGRYAPYGPEINSWQGNMQGKFWEIFEPKEPMTAATMTKRMLPSEPPP